MKLRLIVIAVILTGVYSCTKLKEDDIVFDAERQKLCDLDSARFSEHIAPIISSNCMPCHDNSQASGGLTLVTYDDISFLALDGILIKSINHSAGAVPMPSGTDKLHECYIQAIELWTAQGALNN